MKCWCIYFIRNVADIMDTEEQDQKIRMSARDALDKVSGKGKVLRSILYFRIGHRIQTLLEECTI